MLTEEATELVAAAAALAVEYSMFTKEERLLGRDKERDSAASGSADAGECTEAGACTDTGDTMGAAVLSDCTDSCFC